MSKSLTEADIRYTIDGIISSIKEKGTYIHALEKFGRTLKKFQSPHDLINTTLRLIEQKETNVVLNLIRIIYKSGVRGFDRTDIAFKSWKNRVLDEAVLFADWSVANFIIRFSIEPDLELEKDEFWDPQLAKKATPDQWGKAIQLLVKWYVPFGVRCRISCTRLAPEWRKNLGHMKKVVETGHMTILDAIKYPSAFMLMVHLGVDLPPQLANDYIITLPYAVWSSGMKKLQRAQLLEFLRDVNPTQFDAPCGPNHVPVIYEILRNSDLYIFKKLSGREKIDMNMRDSKGRGIGYYIHHKLIFNGIFTSKDRLDYGSTAINKKNTPAVEIWMKHYISDAFLEAHPEIMQALRNLVQRDSGLPSRWVETTEDLFLLAYFMSHELKPPQKNGLWNELYEVWALKDKRRDRVAVENDPGNLSCLIYDLPDEIINLIALEASFIAMMNLFLTSKVMQQAFARMTSTSLWKEVAKRHFNAHKLSYLATQPITDWRSHIIKEMRWRKNWVDQRFTERTVLPEMKGAFTLTVVDDNWFVSISAMKVYCWNCHTGQSHSMHISRITLGYSIIIESTPTTLKVAINGVRWDTRDSVIIIAEPLADRVLKQIRPCVPPQYQLPFFFKYQSKLCHAATDLLEVDVEAGTTKLLKKLESDRAIKSIAYDSDNNELLIVRDSNWEPPQKLDADLNLVELSAQSITAESLLQKVIKESSSEFIAAMKLLDFGQWYCKPSTHIPNSLMDHQNDRILIKKGRAGISLLLHPNLKTWYTAWIDSPKKFVAMNSRYLFLYDTKKECFYCRDFT